MGMHRGQRNRNEDRWLSEQRRATQSGMVGAAVAALCAKCGEPVIAAELFEGWCRACVNTWIDSTDPWLIYQAQQRLPVDCIPTAMMKEVERLTERVIDPALDDRDFLPLTQFMGNRGVGSQRTMWNVLQAMYVFEFEKTSEVHQFGVYAPNTLHLCGRHAPIQRSSIGSILSRIHSAGDEFKLLQRDKQFHEYLRGFVFDNKLDQRGIFTLRKTSIDVYSRYDFARSYARYGAPHFDKHQPQHWPFEGDYDGLLREKEKLEPLPDIVMEIGELVPFNMPATLREDLCQDLCVAVLSGETTIDELKNGIRHYVAEAFKHHPLKYGRLSLTGGYKEDDDKSLGMTEWLTDDDVDPKRADRGWLAELCIDPDEKSRGWHAGRNRERGLARVGEILRDKHGGAAIVDGPMEINESSDMDPEIAEVYEADQAVSWRRKLSD